METTTTSGDDFYLNKILEECRNMMQGIGSSLTLVAKNGNEVAQCLATMAYDYGERVWIEEVPNEASQCLQSDVVEIANVFLVQWKWTWLFCNTRSRNLILQLIFLLKKILQVQFCVWYVVALRYNLSFQSNAGKIANVSADQWKWTLFCRTRSRNLILQLILLLKKKLHVQFYVGYVVALRYNWSLTMFRAQVSFLHGFVWVLLFTFYIILVIKLLWLWHVVCGVVLPWWRIST